MSTGESQDSVLTVEGASQAPKQSALDSQLAKGGAVNAEAFKDYSTGEAVSEDSLAALAALAQEQVECERSLAEAMAAVVRAKIALADVQEHKLPDLMEKHGLPKFNFVDKTTGQTRTIEFISKWSVSLPAKTGKTADPQWRTKHDAIYDWLEQIGKGSIIKRDMVAPLGLMADSEAVKIISAFKESNPTVDVAFQKYVEPASMSALISRMKDAGETVNEFINVKPVRESRVKGSK